MLDGLKEFFSKDNFILKKMRTTFTKENFKRYLKDNRATLIFFGVIIVFVVWGLISVRIAKANAVIVSYADYVAREVTHDPATVFDTPYNYELVASDDHLELYFDFTHATVQVKDKDSGFLWKGVVDNDVYSKFSTANKKWKQRMSSSVIVSYNDLEARDGREAELTHAGECDWIETKKIENGVEAIYGFTSKGIYVTVQFVIENGEFAVKVPVEGITEETRYIVNTITVVPYFGAASLEAEGYMLYPDGCGAITLLNNTENRVQSVKAGEWRTYSNDKVSLDYWMMTDEYERYNAAMPVFGIKNGDNAILGVITQGEENSGIVCEPAGRVIDVNRIYSELYMRNQIDLTASNVTNADGTVTTGRDITRIDKDILQNDREVRFFFLHNEDANYSGMARSYRNYLIERGQLNDAIADGEEYPLALSFLMGTTERQLVSDVYVTMTSFENLKTIFDDLMANGVKSSKTLLTHWVKKDENYPTYWPVANQIGGKDGLKDFGNYAGSKGIDVFLDQNLIFGDGDEGGFSKIDDVVYSGINIPISAEYNSDFYLLSPSAVLRLAKDFLDKTADYSNIGIGYANIGNVTYEDYNEENPSTREQTVETWKELFATTKAAGKKAAADGPNQYSYGNVDYIYNIPIANYGLSITDYAVPFVQMVVSGLIPYSAGIYEAGNLTYDLDIQKLEWIEFGALPYFYLTYEDALKLKDTDLNFLFTSTYSFWRDRVINTYNEFEENFGDTYGEQMVSHEVLSEDVRRVEYSNGKIIYLNYSEKEVIIDGVTIPAKGYTVTGKGAN